MKKYSLFCIMLLACLCASAASPYCVLSDNTMTFYYDENMSSHTTGTNYDLVYSGHYPKWTAKASLVRTVVFDSSFADALPTDGSYWFYNMSNLTSIQGLSNLNTSNMTLMSGMFQSCSKLAYLDLRSFDTKNVMRMNSMFNQCSSLTTLLLDNWDVSHVKNMNSMFYGCYNLESIDITNFDTSKVTRA